jgi:hypothetical protein
MGTTEDFMAEAEKVELNFIFTILFQLEGRNMFFWNVSKS